MLVVIFSIALIVFLVYNVVKIIKSKKAAGKGMFEL
jgi:flagellar biogenesis protein FliO